jgi:hypothetical protein
VPERVDIATFAAEQYDDAWRAMAESYAAIGMYLVAVLQHTGPLTLAPDALERAGGYVAVFDPVGRHGAVRVAVVPRSESGADPSAPERIRAKWERQYERKGSAADGGER